MALKAAGSKRHSVAIYCRISQDGEGSGLGVSRQEEDCRELADRRGQREKGSQCSGLRPTITTYSVVMRPPFLSRSS